MSGLLAFKDAFADMREAVDVTKLQDTAAIQQGTGEAASVDRALLTSKHGTRSSGVNVAGLSRETGGVALAGRQTTKVDAPPEEKGTGGVQKIQAGDARQRSSKRSAASSIPTKARSLRSTTERCARIRPCRVRSCWNWRSIPQAQSSTVAWWPRSSPTTRWSPKSSTGFACSISANAMSGRTKISYPVHFLPS